MSDHDAFAAAEYFAEPAYMPSPRPSHMKPRAVIGQARRSFERTMQSSPAERRDALRRLADQAYCG